MKTRQFPILFALAALVLAALACEVSASSANVAEAWTSSDEAGDARTTVFTQEDVFYAQVDLRNAPDDTSLKAVWTAVEAEETEPGLVITETEITTGSDLIHFSLTNDYLWPVGSYKVDVYLNGELAETLAFEVR